MNVLKMARVENHGDFFKFLFKFFVNNFEHEKLSCFHIKFCPPTYLLISEKGVRHPHLKHGGKYHFVRTSLSQLLPQRHVIITDIMIGQVVVKSCYHNEAMETIDAQCKRGRGALLFA